MSGIIFTIQFVIALFAHYLISVSGFIAVALCITMSKYHLLDESNSARKPLTGAVFALFGLSLLLTPTLYLSHLHFDLNDIAYIKETISEEDRKNHTFLFSVAPGLYLNTGINVVYPDFNAQTYHLKLSKKYTVEHMASFVQSEDCHYLVMKKDEVVYFRALIGTEMYLKESVTKWTPTTIIIYRHVIL